LTGAERKKRESTERDGRGSECIFSELLPSQSAIRCTFFSARLSLFRPIAPRLCIAHLAVSRYAKSRDATITGPGMSTLGRGSTFGVSRSSQALTVDGVAQEHTKASGRCSEQAARVECCLRYGCLISRLGLIEPCEVTTVMVGRRISCLARPPVPFNQKFID